jgi:hypothetical protein
MNFRAARRPPENLNYAKLTDLRLIMPENNLIVRPDDDLSPDYPILHRDTMQEMLSIFQDNIGDGSISTRELPRIKCPTGGGTTWHFETPDGEESARELEGLILAWRKGRVFWKTPEPSNKPPDCVSLDGFFGKGDPGGKCADCKYAQFGSSLKGGRGQACKQIRQMLIVRPGEVLPYLLSVPPTSLRNASQYFLMLVGRQIPFWGITTKIKLEKVQNEGVPYSRMIFYTGRRLSPQEAAIVKPYHVQMKQVLSPLTIDANDYSTDGEEPSQNTEGNEIPF